MPIEREAKMRVSDHAAVRARLEEVGSRNQGRVLESNTFFDTDDRRLLVSGEGLRLRRATPLDDVKSKSPARVTFKGPQQPGDLKVRQEIEFDASDAEALEQVFERIGLARVLRFEKRRETWTLDGCEIALDELPRLGFFVEIEGPSDAAVMAVRGKLGLSDAPLLTTSYAAMLSQRPDDDSGSGSRDVRFGSSE